MSTVTVTDNTNRTEPHEQHDALFALADTNANVTLTRADGKSFTGTLVPVVDDDGVTYFSVRTGTRGRPPVLRLGQITSYELAD